MAEATNQPEPLANQATKASEKTEQPAEVTLQRLRFTSTAFSKYIAVGFFQASLLLGLIEASSYLWEPISIVLYLLVLVLGILFFTGALLKKPEEVKEGRAPVGVSQAFVVAIAFSVAFSQVSRHLYHLFGGYMAVQTGYWYWVRFGIDQLLNGALFGGPAIYGWHISDIEPTAFWSRTLVYLFTLGLAFLVIATCLKEIQIGRQGWQRLRLDRNQSYFRYLYTGLGRLTLFALWVIPLAIGIGAAANAALSWDSTWAAIRFFSPVVFGIWLIWESLRALALSGARNKWLAFAFLVVGGWLVWATWPPLATFLSR